MTGNNLAIATPKNPGSRHLWVNSETTWPDICAWVKNPRTGTKKSPGYVLGVLQVTTGCSVSPNCTKLHRNKQAVVSRNTITLDPDHLTPATRDALMVTLRALGWNALVHSTSSSTPAEPHLHILLQLDRTVTPEEYKMVVNYLIALLAVPPNHKGEPAFDSSCNQPSRLMYMPTTPAEGEFFSEVMDGVPLPADVLLLDASLVLPEPAGAPKAMAPGVSTRLVSEEAVRAHAAEGMRLLDEMCALPEGERMPHWPGLPDNTVSWEGGGSGILMADGRIAQAHLANPVAYPLDEAWEDMDAHAPEYGPREYKWEQALKWARDNPMPYTWAEDVFGADNDGETHAGQVRMAFWLANSHTDKLLYVRGTGWHCWDGQRWAEDDQGRAKRAVVAVLKRALRESVTMGKDEKKKLRADVAKCESDGGINGVLGVAASLEPFAATVRDLDADPWLLNCANGTLDLHTLTLRPHSPADRITKITNASYTPGARSPLWQGFLDRVLPDHDVQGFLARYVGAALIGKVYEHTLAILTGTGRNGKGVFYGAIGQALGDYAISAEPDLLMEKQGAHPAGEMDLRGVRWAVVSESDQGRRLAEATVKRLTGGDKIKARYMRENFVQFEPSHTIALVTNHLPRVRGDDPALWARLRVVPFDVVIPPSEQNKSLGDELGLEINAILTWAIEGLADYHLIGGLAEPDAVMVATQAYEASGDAVGRFIDACCVVGQSSKVAVAEIYYVWKRWLIADGGVGMAKNAFGTALDTKGYSEKVVTVDGKSVRMRLGIVLNPDGLALLEEADL